MAPKDQRTKSAYIFGAVCPQRGVGAGLVLPRCNTQAMQWHLDEISSQVAPGAHAVLIIDRAAWHTTGKLTVPPNITLLLLPPRAPELNPVENNWLFMRDNYRNLDELRDAVRLFVGRYNDQWLVEKNGFLSPNQAREKWNAVLSVRPAA